MEGQDDDHVIERLHRAIATELSALGKFTPYVADANEPDVRYRGYGVRAPEMKRMISDFKSDLASLKVTQKIELAKRLIGSGYGEQKSIALTLLEQVPEYFTPDRFEFLEKLIRSLHGWSKVDSFTKLLLPQILKAHENQFIELLKSWNSDDDLWLRRASVVIFTRKVAKSGRYKDLALENCNALIKDSEHLVQTGVGWCLRDLMRWHKDEILSYVIGLRQRGISSRITLYALRDIKGDERRAVLDQTVRV